MNHTGQALFDAWVATVEDDRLDVLVFASALICLCKARYVSKMREFFTLFDFDGDGLLNRHELSALVRGVSVALHRVYGLGVINPPSFIFQTGGGGSDGLDRSVASVSSSTTQVREPNAKQCERWNETHVRRFEAALRTGQWNIEGWLEFAQSSALAVHLLGAGMRTASGGTTTTDAGSVFKRLQEAQLKMQPVVGYNNTGSSLYNVRAMKFATREEALIGASTPRDITQPPGATVAKELMQTPRTARGKPVANFVKDEGVIGMTHSASTASAVVSPIGLQSDRSVPIAPSAASQSQNRFKFTGRNTAREVKNLKKLFDEMDIDSSGYLSLDYLRKPKKVSAIDSPAVEPFS